jgi:hypothetical protein
MDCQLLVSENIFLKYVSNYLEIELEKIFKMGIDNTLHPRNLLSGIPGTNRHSRNLLSGIQIFFNIFCI